MSRQLIKQPNGRYALFSSGTDSFVSVDLTAEEFIHLSGQKAKREAENAARELVAAVDTDPRKAYFQFAMTWDEAYAQHLDSGLSPVELKP